MREEVVDFTFVPGPIKGDVNMDDVVNFSNIAPFIVVLQSGVFQAEADCDCSTVVDFSDIPGSEWTCYEM